MIPRDEQLHIHLIAICGTAMGALAGMLKALGHRVTGSDENVYPPMSTQLEQQGIEILEGFDASHLEPAPDLVVIGNAMSRGNPEVEHVLAHDIAYTSMAACIEELFLTDKRSLVVAGTHGKSTTTSLLAWLLSSAGRDPGFLVGGVPLNFGTGWHVGTGTEFVIEGDEYDTAFFDKESKFLHYRPEITIITSVEFDHADIFDDLEQIDASFRKLVGLIPEDGTLLLAANTEGPRRVSEEARCRVLTYGVEEDADWKASGVSWEEGTARFRLEGPDAFSAPMRSPMLGRHNLYNAVAALAAAHTAGASAAELAEGLQSYRGIKRRQEILGTPGGVVVIDDFAHHPTAVQATLDALRLAYPERRIWVLFEPRSNTTQRNVFQEAYVRALGVADRVILARLHRPEKVEPAQRLDPERLARELERNETWARYIPDPDEIIQTVCQNVQPQDLVAILSNGAFYGIHAKLLDALSSSV